MVYEKKELDPAQYVDILRAFHITTAIMTDAIGSLAKMEIVQPQDAVRTCYKALSTMDDIVKNKQFSVVDQGNTFRIFVRR